MKGTGEKVLIVGGSLSGLTLALACASRGVCTCVLDQVGGYDRDGAALGVDRALLLRTIGAASNSAGEGVSFPAVTEHRLAISWKGLHGWLRTLANRHPEITFMGDCRVAQVEQHARSASAFTMQGQRIDARAIIGADGYRSVVRRAISPERPEPRYAGYLLWRGLIPETNLPLEVRPRTNDGVALVNEAGYRLVAYPVAGEHDSLDPGRRLISFAWYDKTRDMLLQERRCVSPAGHVLASLSPESIPAEVRHELKELAVRVWPEPWGAIIVHALESGKVFATPVAEYCPERLHSGRLAIIGDAAHVVSPATGKGFTAGILDAEALADSLANSLGQTADGFSCALEDYGHRRLPTAQQLAARSMDWSRDYLRGANMSRWVTPRKVPENKP